MSSENVKIISQEEFEINPFKSLKIGDPMYFDTELGLEYTADISQIPVSNRIARIYLEKNVVSFNDELLGNLDCNNIRVMIWSEKKSLPFSIAELHKTNRYIPNNIQKEVQLGCDTACFNIEINGITENIQTGTDGEYGRFYHYKNNDAFIVDLLLDADYVNYDQLKEKLSVLFDTSKMITNKKSYENWLEDYAKSMQDYGKNISNDIERE